MSLKFLKLKHEPEDSKPKTMKRKKETEDEENEPQKKVKTTKSKENNKAKKSSKNDSVHLPRWKEQELLADQYNISVNAAKNIIGLFEEGNTIPFIARYRRDVTNNMTPEDLRAVKESYEEIVALKNKVSNVVKTLEKSGILNEDLKRAVTCATSHEELEYVYAPFKPGSKRTLAERAKELGLEEPALMILNNKKQVTLKEYINLENKDLSSIENVEKGIIHIIASIIATDTEILSSLKELRKKTNFVIKTKKHETKKGETTKGNYEYKFDNYFDFEISVKYIKPHQVLAISRGESLKVLSVKIIVPANFTQNFQKLCYSKWVYGKSYQMREKIIKAAIDDSYQRLVEPLIKREIRSELKQKSESASCEVFITNLKQLLLATPIKGKAILGIDPGFAKGCKLAIISSIGNLLDSDVIYPHKNKQKVSDVATLKNMLLRHNCELIALGNGTACRQTEEWLTNLIQTKTFHPLNVRYTIVREEGASIYSCSLEAKKEFPSLDPNIISAVSLARRIQNPLAELIKVEPKHLGIGMYQHDVKKKHLDDALNDVISECVSFVGVDLNTASQCLLKHVAGLSEKKAQQIIDYRNKNGTFICRKQLMEISGIGQKVFQQCAGFLRVGPLNEEEAVNFYKNKKAIKFDCTNIHPESYEVAMKIMKKLDLKLEDIGESHFISTIRSKILELDLDQMSKEFNSKEQTIHLILDSLSKPLNHDFRNDCSMEPVFKKGLTSISDLKSGSVLTGVVNNVTHFGCFVDIGVESNGLIHISKCNGLDLKIGTKVEVKLLNIDIIKKRIQLQALKIL